MELKWRHSLVLLGVVFTLCTEASSSWHMNDFIKALKNVEDLNPGLKPVDLLRGLRTASGLDDAFIQHYLGRPEPTSTFASTLPEYLITALHHDVSQDSRELGVVLTSDGSTVALRPLLLGIEAGFLPSLKWDIPSNQPSISKTEKLQEIPNLAADGCWNNLINPQVFTLSEKTTLLTTAQVNGGMDGVILGQEASKTTSLKLSSLLSMYFDHKLDERGMDAAPRIISQRRRENFMQLVKTSESSLGVLMMEAVAIDQIQRREKGKKEMSLNEKIQMMAEVKDEVKELVQMYSDCPPIIKRCQWGARPFIGSPTYLSLPLGYLFIHHTYSPSQPCVTFEQCSADMRSMQRYHQDSNGWSDIGYNFLAGSDGNIYEGRGWSWQGAHSPGYNSLSYGVSFIGDYTRNLPTAHSMMLVRDKLASCAVVAGRLTKYYDLKGHRQAVATSCPGDALYREIQKWAHYAP